MTVNVGTGTTDRSHWANRAQALLAPLLHAAAVHGRDMETVVDWVMRHELDEPGILLEDERCSQLAFGSLLGLLNTEERERSSIFSAAADALQAYTERGRARHSRRPELRPGRVRASGDTVYIYAPAEEQAAVAPVVCGLLAEIRRATYRAHAAGQLPARVLFALDEVANIAPLQELPQIASEGGGQGLPLLAALQDLSQARPGGAAGRRVPDPVRDQADPARDRRHDDAGGGLDDARRVRPPGRLPHAANRNLFSRPRKKVAEHELRPRSAPACSRPARSRTSPPATACTSTASTGSSSTLTPAHRDEPWRTLTAVPVRMTGIVWAVTVASGVASGGRGHLGTS